MIVSAVFSLLFCFPRNSCTIRVGLSNMQTHLWWLGSYLATYNCIKRIDGDFGKSQSTAPEVEMLDVLGPSTELGLHLPEDGRGMDEDFVIQHMA